MAAGVTPLKAKRPAPIAERAVTKQRGLKPLWLALILDLVFASFCLLPRVQESRPLLIIFAATTAFLFLLTALVFTGLKKANRTPTYVFVPRSVHYVQLAMHLSIYIYWGMFWPEVARHAPLIAAQIVVVALVDMLLCWTRRDTWQLGFGPIPIVLSTNLFLWFRDDWFYLQFVMMAVGVLGKEFIRWERDGRKTHIFNPSAFPLFITSILLLATGTTGITWGPEISQTLHLPPHIYTEVFILGLIVQALFSVTLVTLSAAAMLYALNVFYTHQTGVYYFIDSNIPISVFIGLHLLVTDPATSPRTAKAKLIFGGLYGAGVFTLYGILGALNCPQFYDKLLCVPPLNLSVRFLDRMSAAIERAIHSFRMPDLSKFTPRQLNFAHMAVWIPLFLTMSATNFVGHTHPGQDPKFWEQACGQHRADSCKVWVRTLNIECRGNNGDYCLQLGKVLNAGLVIPRDAVEGGKSIARACDLGVAEACASLGALVQKDGTATLQQSCDHGDGANCFILGSLLHLGREVPKDDSRAITLFERGCTLGWPRACSRLGESYLFGEGTPANPLRAIQEFDAACSKGYGPGCVNAALMYRRGNGIHANEILARQRYSQACKLGIPQACQFAQSAAAL